MGRFAEEDDVSTVVFHSCSGESARVIFAPPQATTAVRGAEADGMGARSHLKKWQCFPGPRVSN